jgi:hypothetical protein
VQGRTKRPRQGPPPEPRTLTREDETGIRQRLRDYVREEFGTVYQLHRRLGVPLSTANGWLGQKVPSLASLAPLVANGLSLDGLVRGKGPLRYAQVATALAGAPERTPERMFRRVLREAVTRAEGARFEEAAWDRLPTLRTATGGDVVLALAVEGVRPLYRELADAYRATQALRAEAAGLDDPKSRAKMLAFAEQQLRTFRPKHPAVEFIGWTEQGGKR